MDIASLLLGLALLLVVAAIVARPLVERGAARDRQPGAADQLLFERERVLTQLRDLDFDHATGKLVEEDYTLQRAQLMAQGAAILKQLDALGLGGSEDEIEQAIALRRGRPAKASSRAAPTGASQRPARGAPKSAAEEIEARVAQRRSATPPAGEAPKAEACAQCGTPARPGDRFCAKCGAALIVDCVKCGRAARAGDQFCASCGEPLPSGKGGLQQAKARG